MQTDHAPRATVTGYTTGPITKAPAWHGLVVADTLLNSLTTGLFLAAAICELAAPDTFARLAKAAYPVALVLLLADLLCLVLDLGDRLRFHHMLRVFKPSSPMSLGVWCLTAYSVPLTVIVAIDLLPAGGSVLDWCHRAAVVIGLLPALGSAVYKGVLFSTSAQPGWKDARWLGGYLTGSALVLGTAQLLGLALLLGSERAVIVLRPALALLLVLGVILLGLLVADLRTALVRNHHARRISLFAVLALGGGVVVPLVLLFATDGPLPTLAAVACIVLGSLLVRFVLVWLPHGLPSAH